MSDSLLRQTARARPRKVPRRLSGTNYARATNTYNLFLVMTVIAVAFFFLLASTLHGSGLEAAERGDFSRGGGDHGLHALRRNRAHVPHVPHVPHIPAAPDQPRVAPAAKPPVDDAPAPPPKLDVWEDPVLRKDDAAIASELARPPADDAEAAARTRRALAVDARRAVEAEMKASAGPLKAIPADSPYKPWALDAKNQRWRLQAMHPVYKRRPNLPSDASTARRGDTTHEREAQRVTRKTHAGREPERRPGRRLDLKSGRGT